MIVGRKDDRTDDRVQLRDGAALLQAKERALKLQCEARGIAPVHPIMLVNCESIEHAAETVAFLRSDDYMDGAYADAGAVLEIHSKTTDEALAALDEVEDPGSPCRIIVQVSMLKEGWDVKNIYVIASLRASVSDILTEQTLGRGLRLPFGGYTDMPLINELDVLAHEQYSKLLARTSALKETFVDKRTVIDVWTDSHGKEQVDVTTEETTAEVTTPPAGSEDAAPALGAGTIAVGSTEGRLEQAEAASNAGLLLLDEKAPKVVLPQVSTKAQTQEFQLESITEKDPFTTIGHKLAVDPERHLRRTKIEASVTEVDGEKTTAIKTTQAQEKVEAMQVLDDVEQAKVEVLKQVMDSKTVPSRKGQVAQVKRLLDYCLEGAGDKAELVLSVAPRALASSIIGEIEKARDALPPTNLVTEVTGVEQWAPVRLEREPSSADRFGEFEAGLAYAGWHKGMFEQAWFDSSPERAVANILDDADEIAAWARLHRNDIPILWRGGDHTYNPDLLAVEDGGRFWLIEVKADKDMSSKAVQEKRSAAKQWANYVNGSGLVPGKWAYILASESNIETANGSWKTLAALAE